MSDNKIDPKIYLLEDNSDFIEIAVSYFKKMNINFQIFTDPDEYLSQTLVKTPTLSMIDLNFHGKSLGFDVLKKVRERGDKHPIIVVSGSKAANALIYSLECGANDFIQKPVTRTELDNKISNFLTTEELEGWIEQEVDVKAHKIEAEIEFEGKIMGFDEVGFYLQSEHFFTSGSYVILSGEIIEEIFGGKKKISVIITSSSYHRKSNTYESFAEYTFLPDEDINSIKDWIHRHST